MHADDITLDTYRRLRVQARRHAQRAADVEDLVQEVLLIALEQGRARLDDEAWLAGVLRHRAAMQARGAVRRRRREGVVAMDSSDAHAVADSRSADRAITDTSATASAAAMLMARLPPAARRVAVLALHGLNAEEIRCVLDISATAFRQRLTSLRKALGTLPAEQRAEALALAYVRDPARSVDLQFGLIRRALKAALRGEAAQGPGIGTHDADGHLLVLRGRAHTSAAGGNG